MEASKEYTCPNCNHSGHSKEVYCPNCGQKHAANKISIKEFFYVFIDSIFNFDASVFKTISKIWIPGALTKEYFSGKRKQYFHPLRLFLLAAVVHIAALSFIISDLSIKDLDELRDTITEIKYKEDYNRTLDSIAGNIKRDFQNKDVNSALDTLIVQLQPKPENNDSIKQKVMEDLMNSEDSLIQQALREEQNNEDSIHIHLTSKDGNSIFDIEAEEFITKDFETLKEQYNIKGRFQETILRQIIKFFHRPEKMTSYAFANILWMTLFMMPFLAGIMKLLYLRRSRYFVEHLVFLLHVHALVFLVSALLYLLNSYITDWGVFTMWSVMLFYLYWAMKTYYQQGYFKTFYKFTILLLSYPIILFIFGLLLIGFSFVFF